MIIQFNDNISDNISIDDINNILYNMKSLYNTASSIYLTLNGYRLITVNENDVMTYEPILKITSEFYDLRNILRGISYKLQNYSNYTNEQKINNYYDILETSQLLNNTYEQLINKQKEFWNTINIYFTYKDYNNTEKGIIERTYILKSSIPITSDNTTNTTSTSSTNTTSTSPTNTTPTSSTNTTPTSPTNDNTTISDKIRNFIDKNKNIIIISIPVIGLILKNIRKEN